MSSKPITTTQLAPLCNDPNNLIVIHKVKLIKNMRMFILKQNNQTHSVVVYSNAKSNQEIISSHLLKYIA